MSEQTTITPRPQVVPVTWAPSQTDPAPGGVLTAPSVALHAPDTREALARLSEASPARGYGAGGLRRMDGGPASAAVGGLDYPLAMDQPYSTRPSATEIVAAVPGLAPYALPAVVLVPAPEKATVHQSSVGGPLLWPADEAWPCCDVPDEKSESGTPATAMVAVAQVYRKDAPGDWWPEGKDVFQLLWCPNVHWDPPAPHADVSPVAEIRWRNSADVRRILESPPLPVRQEDPDYGYTAVPCTLTPVPLVDFPYPQTLPDEELIASVQEYVEATGKEEENDVITRVAGIKFGGWPTWHLTDPYAILCLTCSAPCHLLFTVASDHTTGITVGRWGDFRIFACPAGEGHGYVFDQH